MTQEETAPKLFISYSWTSPQHEKWVVKLAEKLVASGVDAILDKWNLKEGQDTIAFMEGMVADSTIDKVLMVVDKNYAEKANAREGGVGTETQIISKKVYENKGQEKFVALVLDKDDNGNPYLPVYCQSRIYIDFSESHGEKEFEKLLRWIFDKPLNVKPALGKPPAVEEIESDRTVNWTPIPDSKYMFSDRDLEDINDKLNTLIDTAHPPKTDPAFALGNDNRLHIIPPPDNQPVDSQDDLLNELRTITDDLLQSLRGANAHQDLIPIIEQYKEAISGNQMSISRLYGRGVRLDNVVRAIKRGIEAKEQPSLSLNTESNLNSVLEIHGAYIMSSVDGRQLEQDAVDYNQPPEQPEGFKEAVEQFSNSIKNNTALFDESVREYVPNIVMDIGIRQPQKRSDKIGERTLTNFVSALIKGIGKIGVKAIQWITVSAVAESTLGQIAITAGTDFINTVWGFLINNAPLIKTITDYLSSKYSWLESASKFLEYIISMITGD